MNNVEKDIVIDYTENNLSFYITEDTSLSIDDLKESLPYFSILLDLFKFDNDYRRKTRDYRIDIRVDFDRALAFYLDHNDNF